ncbi:MAG TPA: hypothetical protein VL326_32950 [Kofleriaceae bacterium]|jgi:hypothetical protein|nr:hypothetical protein [Kofleriaceae bacterium]
MLRTTAFLILLVGCADRVEPEDPTRVCEEASDILVQCGFAIDTSPFGTCQVAEHEHAEDLVAVYDDEGCAGLTSSKADGLACSAVPFLCVDHTVAELAPFTTDGCSMFPDGTLSNPTKWQHCCITHDFAYYAGGPSDLREAADSGLRECIASETNQLVADIVYYAVRAGGTPALPTPWRWGYGWFYDPLDGYRALPSTQSTAAAKQIASYKEHPVPPMAIEQRLLALAGYIATVPGLSASMEQLKAVIHALD